MPALLVAEKTLWVVDYLGRHITPLSLLEVHCRMEKRQGESYQPAGRRQMNYIPFAWQRCEPANAGRLTFNIHCRSSKRTPARLHADRSPTTARPNIEVAPMDSQHRENSIRSRAKPTRKTRLNSTPIERGDPLAISLTAIDDRLAYIRAIIVSLDETPAVPSL
jgi:hypothetical protein